MTLLARVQAQQPDAWEKLVELYAPLVNHWCRRSDLPPEDAADVFQEVFRSVAASISSFQRDRRVETSKNEPNANIANTDDKSNGTTKNLSEDLVKRGRPAIGLPEIELVDIKPGKFSMGSPAEDSQARRDEKPKHEVEISKPFLLGKFEVTIGQYAEVMQQNKDQSQSGKPRVEKLASEDADRLPMSGISWLEAIQFCNRLSERHGLTPYYQIDGKTDSIQRGSDGFR